MKHGHAGRARLLAQTALLSLALTGTASAQGTDELLGTIIIYSGRISEELLEFPARVDVVEEDEIQEHHITDMQELVRGIAGVSVPRQTTSTDPFNTFGGFVVRGVGGNRVAITVDGARVAERIIDGTRDYLDFNFTRQVEIRSGPASVLWGADALGGLVALETIDPEDVLDGRDRGVELSFGYDDLNEATNGSITFAQRLSPTLEVLVGLSRENSHEAEFSNARNDGGIWGCPRNITFGATPCGELDPTDEQSTRALISAVWTPSDEHRVEFTFDRLVRDTDVNQLGSIGPVFSSFSGLPTGEVVHSRLRNLERTRDRYAIEHTWTVGGSFLDELQTTLSFSPYESNRTGSRLSTSSGGDTISSTDELFYSEEFLELDIQGTASFSIGNTDHLMVFGFDGDIGNTEYFRRDITTNLTTNTTTERRAGGFNFADAETRRADFYLQDTITFGNSGLSLTPGLRFATYEITPEPNADYQIVVGREPQVRSDEALIASLALEYDFNDNWSAWARYGEGFKMPTAQQLYTSLPGFFFNLIPAPNLQPEESETFEVGFRYETARGHISVNAFDTNYRNFIQSFYFIPGTSDITYRNISRVDIWGVEVSGAWELTDTTQIGLSASWQKGEQEVSETSGVTDFGVEPLTAVISLAHEIPQYNLMLEGVATFVGDVRHTSSPTAFRPGGYGLLDLYASWEVVDNGYLRLGVQNVFDRRYFQSNAQYYQQTASASVARANPIELQTGPGRTFSLGFDMSF